MPNVVRGHADLARSGEPRTSGYGFAPWSRGSWDGPTSWPSSSRCSTRRSTAGPASRCSPGEPRDRQDPAGRGAAPRWPGPARCRCSGAAARAAEGAPAYWPWRRILRAWLALVGPRRAPPRRWPAFGEVARLAPELPGEPVGSDRFALFDAVARFLAAVAEEAGLVLVLDDVQWADADSLALLAHVTREVTRGAAAGRRHRPARRASSSRRAALVDRARRVGRRRRSAPRSPIGSAGGPTPDVVAAVARRSGGNPFFVGELARAGSSALRVPAAVRDVVRARIRRLPEPCRALLGAAAVLGRDVDATLLSSVTGRRRRARRPAARGRRRRARPARRPHRPALHATTSSARACSPTCPRRSRRGCTSRSSPR